MFEVAQHQHFAIIIFSSSQFSSSLHYTDVWQQFIYYILYPTNRPRFFIFLIKFLHFRLTKHYAANYPEPPIHSQYILMVRIIDISQQLQTQRGTVCTLICGSGLMTSLQYFVQLASLSLQLLLPSQSEPYNIFCQGYQKESYVSRCVRMFINLSDL